MISYDKKQKVENRLKMLNLAIPEIKGSIAMTYSGELIADSLPMGTNSEELRIGLRNYTAATHRYLDELDKVEMVEEIINKYTDSYIVILRENQSLLMVITTKYVRLGLIMLDMKRASEHIDKIISS